MDRNASPDFPPSCPAVRGALRHAFYRAVHAYLLIEETELAVADLAVLCGSVKTTPAIAQRGAQLFHDGYANRFIVSGRVKATPQETEAEMMRRILIENGVPDQSILLENRATNTQENIVYARRMMMQRGEMDQIHTIITVGNITAGRRTMMTAARRWPEVFAMHATGNKFPVPAQDFYTHTEFRRVVLREWAKIAPYMANGWLKDVDIDAINTMARALPQPGQHHASP
ncbi:YdcF family protein [Micavibrio aeruginosavorus]|uniref:YdcF family protein n=1 Tax=Micavibrio aeruginosavorus TaxID=349221 RepID=UPI003F4ADB81